VRVDQIIAGALRKIGSLASGEPVKAPEAADALEALRGLYQAFVSEGVFGRQIDFAVPSTTTDFTAREAARYTVEDLASVTITLPTFIENRYWIWTRPYGWAPPGGVTPEPDFELRPPLDGRIISIADLASVERRLFVWDAAIARWTSLLDLQLEDEAPLSTRYGQALQAILGVQLASEYGVELSPSVVLEAARGRSAMIHRYDGPATVSPGVFY
jgi:hypothetical protein